VYSSATTAATTSRLLEHGDACSSVFGSQRGTRDNVQLFSPLAVQQAIDRAKELRKILVLTPLDFDFLKRIIREVAAKQPDDLKLHAHTLFIEQSISDELFVAPRSTYSSVCALFELLGADEGFSALSEVLQDSCFYFKLDGRGGRVSTLIQHNDIACRKVFEQVAATLLLRPSVFNSSWRLLV
jgi:hypothetical protein